MDFSNSRNFPLSGQQVTPPELGLLAGLDSGQLDTRVSGGVYALVPQSPPARYPLWAALLREATRDGRMCHVLIRSSAPDFLERLSKEGWPEVMDAWRDERLRVYPMVEDFATHVFRLDIEGLTAEFGYWGFRADELLLVDAADELLSLHDLTLATSQLAKLRNWARSQNLPVLLNFTLGATAAGLSSLTRLMDNLSGLARIHGDHVGPVLTLEYWQGALGTAAERTLQLEQGPRGYTVRTVNVASVAYTPGNESSFVAVGAGVSGADKPNVAAQVSLAQDKVWARELQMLTGDEWSACAGVNEMVDACAAQDAPQLVLRYGADSLLAELAADVHLLRARLGAQARIVVAEHRVSLRYANEMMLLRLGANAIIRQDIPLARWPAALSALKGQPPRAMPDVDVNTAMTNAASPQGRGYLAVPDFLAQLHAAQERSRVLDVPFALAVIKPVAHTIGKALHAALFRRNGDFITTDGHVVVVFFNACSLTRGQQVLDSTFSGQSNRFIGSVDWMSSERDVDGLVAALVDAHANEPFNLAAYEECVSAMVVASQDPVVPSGVREPHQALERVDFESPSSPVTAPLLASTPVHTPQVKSMPVSDVAVSVAPEVVGAEQTRVPQSLNPVDQQVDEAVDASKPDSVSPAVRESYVTEPVDDSLAKFAGTVPRVSERSAELKAERMGTSVLKRLARPPAVDGSGKRTRA